MDVTKPDVSGMEDPPRWPLAAVQRGLHRLAAVRRERRLSPEVLAEKLRIDVASLRAIEQEQVDMPLSLGYRCQQALGASLRELLVSESDPLSLPPVHRAKLAEWLQTVVAILQEAKQPAIRRMAHNLVDQIVELAPELKDRAAQFQAGNAQLLDDQGRSAGRPLSKDVFLDPSE